VSFCPSVVDREEIVREPADRYTDEELGADLGAATSAERAIYEYTLRHKGMTEAQTWWKERQRDKRSSRRRSRISIKSAR
jgi:hypothetical protein